MPNLIYNLEFKIDKSQLAELKNIVDASTTAEVSTLTEKVKQLETQLEKLKNTQTGVSKSDQQRIKQSKTRVSQLGAVTKLAKEQGKLSKDQIKSLKTLVGTEKEQNKVLISNSLNEKKSLTSRRDLAEQFKRSSTAVANATEVLEAFENQQEKTNQTVLGGDKSFSIANQTLFGFGDLAQDASQFSQGAAQGFRAIGNNIAFNAEMFGLLVQKTGSAKAAFKTLGSQIFGVGGIILLVNVAVTAATTLFTKFGKSSKEASSAVDDFISASADLRKVFDFDFLDIDSLERQNTILSDIAKKRQDVQPIIDKQEKAQRRLNNSNANFNIGAGKQARIISETTKQLKDFGFISELSEKQLKKLEEQIEENNDKIAINKALLESDPLAVFISNTSRATEKTLLFAKAGLDVSNESLQTRRKTLEQLIQKEIDSGLSTDESIVRFKSLQDQLSDVNSELQTQIDLLIKAGKAARDTAGIDAQTGAVRSQINILNTKSEKEKIDLALKQKQKDIRKKLDADLLSTKLSFLKEELTAEEQKARITSLQNKAQADSDLETLNADKAKTDLQTSNILAVSQAGAQGLNSLLSFRSQEIDADIKAAKARGASAKQIEELERKKFRTNKAAQLANAVVNTAANVVEAKPPSPKAIAAGVLGAIQIATILKTKFGGGAPTGGGGGGGGGGAAAAQGLFATSGGDRSSRINRPLFGGQQSGFVPRAQGGAQRFAITVNNTFDEQTAASVVHDGNEQRREGAVSAT